MNCPCRDYAYMRALNENVTLAGLYSGWCLGGEFGTLKK